MKGVRYFFMLLIGLIIAAWIAVKFTIIYIPVGNVGVRIQEYAILGKKGIVNKDFGPGWHRKIVPIDRWERFDSTVQTLEMTSDPRYGDRKTRDNINVQSADGYSISVDVTLKFRIKPGFAHKVYNDTGSGMKYKTIVRNETRSVCIGLFGTMKTEDFYNPSSRREKATEIENKLSKNLEDNFIEVIDVLIRNVQFDPEYENKIRRKKLADQEVELNKSMAKAEEMKGKTQVIEAETRKLVSIINKEKEADLIKMEAQANRDVAKIRAEAEKYATEKQADADLIKAQNEAKGRLLVKEAEATGEKLRNMAMQGVGGSTIVALEAARNLTLTDIAVSTAYVDFLDLEGMADRLGVSAKK